MVGPNGVRLAHDGRHLISEAVTDSILVSNVVRELCAGKGFQFTSAGDATMKGFDEPVALLEVRELPDAHPP